MSNTCTVLLLWICLNDHFLAVGMCRIISFYVPCFYETPKRINFILILTQRRFIVSKNYKLRFDLEGYWPLKYTTKNIRLSFDIKGPMSTSHFTFILMYYHIYIYIEQKFLNSPYCILRGCRSKCL